MNNEQWDAYETMCAIEGHTPRDGHALHKICARCGTSYHYDKDGRLIELRDFASVEHSEEDV